MRKFNLRKVTLKIPQPFKIVTALKTCPRAPRGCVIVKIARPDFKNRVVQVHIKCTMNHKTRHGGGCQPKHQLHCNSSPAIMKKLLSKIGGSRKASNTAQEPLSTSQANATFGATTDGFGSSTSSSEFGPTPRTGTFGSAMADFGATTGGFGSSTTSSEFGYTPSTGTFGSAMTEFGQQGTTIKFQPVTGSDTMMKSGVLLNVSTRHQVRFL